MKLVPPTKNRHVPNYTLQLKTLEKELGVRGTANVFRAALAKAKEVIDKNAKR